jgi:hypothetical protein
MGKKYFALLLLFITGVTWGDIRVVPMDPTPEPDEVEVTIVFPKSYEIKSSNPVQLQFRLDGYSVGQDSEFPRAKELGNSTEGQSLAVFIDNYPPLYINDSLVNALDDTTYYYDQILEVSVPYKLEEGMHLIRTFPVRSFQESLKGDSAFAMDIFYMNVKKGNPDVALKQPLLTYNQPRGTFKYAFQRPILLDFYLTHCQLSKDGYKIRLTIDDINQRFLTLWTPYFIYGLQKGAHKIRLELLDPSEKVVPGPYNDITQTINVK